MGEVWRGHLRQHPAYPLAVKIVAAPLDGSDALVGALLSEARAVAGLDHKNIVRLFDVGEIAGAPYLVMEWAPGSLRGWVPTRWADVHAVLDPLLGALAHAHARGILHLDIKPSNLLVAPSGDLRLADFGLARAVGPVRLELSGTPRYMAPERFDERAVDLDPAADLYAVGCLAWQFVTGSTPFVGSSFQITRAHLFGRLPRFEPTVDVPDGFLDWLRWLLEKDPQARPWSAAEARDELARLAGVPPVEAGPDVHPIDFRVAGHGLSTLGWREPRMVGREDVMDALARRRKPTAPDARLPVVLQGAVGSGRSAVLRAFCRSALEQGAQVVEIRGRDGPAEVLRRLLRRETTAEVSDALVVRAGMSTEEASFVAHALDQPDVEGAIVVRVIVALALGRPTVVAMDDLRSGSWGEAVAQTLAQVGDVVVVLVTDDDLPSAGFDRIELGPLGPIEQRRILDDLLDLEPASSARILAATAGSPAYLVALVRHLADGGAFAETDDGRLRLITDLQFPEDTFAILRTRIDELTEPDGWILLSVLGPPVDETLWRAACLRFGVRWPGAHAPDRRRVGAVRVQDGWSLADPRVVRILNERARTKHKDVAVAELIAAKRAPGLVGQLLLALGRRDEAAEWLGRAVMSVRQSGDVGRTVALLASWEEALAGTNDIRRAELALQRALVARGLFEDPDEYVQRLEEAERLARPRGGSILALVLMRRAEYELSFGRRLDRATAALAEVQALEVADPLVRAEAATLNAARALTVGEMDQAPVMLDRARAHLAEVAHVDEPSVWTRMMAIEQLEVNHAFFRRDWTRADRHLDRRDVLAIRSGWVKWLSDVYNQRLLVLVASDRFEAAIEHGRKALDVAMTYGGPWGRGQVQLLLAVAHLHLDHVREAERHTGRASRLYRPMEQRAEHANLRLLQLGVATARSEEGLEARVAEVVADLEGGLLRRTDPLDDALLAEVERRLMRAGRGDLAERLRTPSLP